ncbi:MAG: hypothetical protein HOY71_34205 [Nonomuraea sp.]|nr:hypothetical protein [Nonomuraea sp.]
MTVLFDPSWVLALATLAAIGMLLLAAWASAVPTAGGATPPSRARSYAHKTAFQRQRDPDAAGRPRPRAPASSPAF